MKKKRTTVSINEPIHSAGLSLMHEDAFDDFSEWLENLIRLKWREKHGAKPFPGLELRGPQLNEPSHDELLPRPNPPRVSYKKSKAKNPRRN